MASLLFPLCCSCSRTVPDPGITPEDCVLLGDDVLAGGLWGEIFETTHVKNRGVAGEGIAEVRRRADAIAAAHPKKLFISVGINDYARQTDVLREQMLTRAKGTRRSTARSAGGYVDPAILEAWGENPILRISDFREFTDRFVGETKRLFKRLHRISPQTELYWVTMFHREYLDPSAMAASKKANRDLTEFGHRSGLFKTVDLDLHMSQAIVERTYSYSEGRWLNDAGYAKLAGLLGWQMGLKTAMATTAARFSEAQFESVRHWNGSYNPNGRMAEYYYDRLSQFLSMPRGKGGVVLFGDSMIDFGPWDELLAEYPVHMRGIAGDQLMGYTARVDEIASQNPAAVVLIGGCNNLVKNPELSPEAIWPDYEALLKALRAALPEVPLFVESILPLNRKDADEYEGFNARAAALNERIAAAAEPYHFRYLDLASLVRDAGGDLRDDLTTDGCHLNAAGYRIWADQLKAALGDEFKRK